MYAFHYRPSLSSVCTYVRLLILTCALSGSVSAAQATFYVDPAASPSGTGTQANPFQTLVQARDAVAALAASPMTDDIIVYLRGGRYELTSTLVFDANDSGSNGFHILYRNYPGESPIITGSQLITGWTADTGGVYKADVGSLEFRQLYTGSLWNTRAQWPNVAAGAGWLDFYMATPGPQGTASTEVYATDIASWSNLTEVELVTVNFWMQYRGFLQSYTVDSGGIFASPVFSNTEFPRQYHNHVSYYWENAREFIDVGGEWYLNRSTDTLYYLPRSGENMASVQIYAPVLERLITIDGAHNLYFYGLTFEQTNWNAPTTNRDYYQRLGGLRYDFPTESELNNSLYHQIWRATPGAIYLTRSDSLRFERNRFRHVGANALLLGSDTFDIEIEGNIFYEIADSAITFEDQEPFPTNAAGNDCTLVRNNYFTRFGRYYEGGSAISSFFPAWLWIEHNEFTDSPGWVANIGWVGYSIPTYLRESTFRFNKMENVTSMSTDSGVIHFKSYGAGAYHTWIYQNWFDNIPESVLTARRGSPDQAAIFRDKETANSLIEENVYTNLGSGVVEVDDNVTGTPNYRVNDPLVDTSATGEPADAVKASAGIQSTYTGIKSVTTSGVIGDTGSPAGFDPTVSYQDTDFFDDFEDGDAAGWTAAEGSAGSWSVASDAGSLRYFCSTTSGGSRIVLTGDSNAADVALEVDVKCDTDGSDDYPGIIVRSTPGASNLYMLQLAYGANAARLYKRVAGTYTQLGSDVATSLTAGTIYRVKLVAVGSHLRTFVDGVLKHDLTDTSLTSGRIGVRSYNAPTRFDNVRSYRGEDFTDNFEDGNAVGWALAEGSGGNWSVVSESGAYRYTCSAPSGNSQIMIAGNPLWANYTVSTDVRSGTDTSGNFSGLIARYVDSGNYYLAQLDWANNIVRLYRKTSGSFTQLAYATVPSGLAANTFYQLSITAIGSSLTVSVDGTPILTDVTDASYPIGAIGLRSYNTVSTFDNITVD